MSATQVDKTTSFWKNKATIWRATKCCAPPTDTQTCACENLSFAPTHKKTSKFVQQMKIESSSIYRGSSLKKSVKRRESRSSSCSKLIHGGLGNLFTTVVGSSMRRLSVSLSSVGTMNPKLGCEFLKVHSLLTSVSYMIVWSFFFYLKRWILVCKICKNTRNTDLWETARNNERCSFRGGEISHWDFVQFFYFYH